MKIKVFSQWRVSDVRSGGVSILAFDWCFTSKWVGEVSVTFLGFIFSLRWLKA